MSVARPPRHPTRARPGSRRSTDLPRADRLFDILRALQDGRLHRAEDLAAQLGVSARTLYRDMDALTASGVPVEGTRGAGYRLAALATLPPLTLTEAELEALNLGIAIVAESGDPGLKAAAQSLADKIDAAQPVQSAPDPRGGWSPAPAAFASVARGFGHMPTLRAAIRARQKLRLTYTSREGGITRRIIRPLRMACWGRIWTLDAWCELRAAHRTFRVDLIDSAEALPELFVDEPGKTLADSLPYSGSGISPPEA